MASRSTSSPDKNAYQEEYKKVKTILVSQPKPERSPYYDLEEKYGLTIHWQQFIHVVGVPEKEFRRNRIRPDDFSIVIFTSKNAIEHFFRICEDMRLKMPQETKYYCLTATIANYLQKFILYRKRKVFVGKRKIEDLDNYFKKHKANETYFLPCSNLGAKDVVAYLDKNKINYTGAMMYKTVATDLSALTEVKYDVLIFFSPLGITSLYENFPSFAQDNTRFAVFGNSTLRAVEERGLYPNIKAPNPEAPSMSMALENYILKTK